MKISIMTSIRFCLKSFLLYAFSFLILIFALINTAKADVPQPFQFAVVGDTDYGFPFDKGLLSQLIPNLLNADSNIKFVVHVGDESLDFKGCSDANLQHYMGDNFNTSIHPWIYVPGDNEWTDCIQHAGITPGAVARDPLESLAYIRDHFYPNRASKSQGKGIDRSQGVSLGINVMNLTRQSKMGDDPSTPFEESKFVENQRWEMNGVMFVTLHMVGSRDNCVLQAPPATLPNYTPAQIGNLSNVPQSWSLEKQEREAANIAWLKDSFAKAKEDNMLGMIILSQANIRFDFDNNDGTCATGLNAANLATCQAFVNYRLALRNEVLNWSKPVMFIHGDNHQFVIQKPWTDLPNFTRVMTFGPPDTGWLRVSVDASNPDLFSVTCGGIVTVDANNNYIGSTCRPAILLTPGQ